MVTASWLQQNYKKIYFPLLQTCHLTTVTGGPKPQLCLCPGCANLFATVTLTTLMHFFTHKNIGQPPNSDGFRDYRKRTVVRNVLSTVT